MDDRPKYKIIIIEDDMLFADTLGAYLSAYINTDLFLAETYEEADQLCNENTFDVAITNIHLKNESSDKLIDLTLNRNFPTIAISRTWSDETQEFIWTKKLADYIIIEGNYTIEYISEISDRIIKNRDISLLIVDDSSESRTQLRKTLEIHRYNIIETASGSEALKILSGNDSIKLVITKYHMPEMSGLELTSSIRQSYNMNELAVIGISSEENHHQALKFIKYGANDFITEPYLNEQLICRVNQNIKIIEQYYSIKDLTLKDPLTGIHNRRFFQEFAPTLYGLSFRNGTPIAVAMLDIDFFKKVNDVYGHQVGDNVLKTISATINRRFRATDIVSRYGGEEFCIFLNNMSAEAAFDHFEGLRRKIASLNFTQGDDSFSITISIGISTDKTKTLTEMIQTADENLYASKSKGRNMTTIN